MSDWSSWLKSNQAMAVIVLIFGGFVAIAMFALVVGLVITLSGINAGLGFSALFMLLMVGYLGLQYVDDDTAVTTETTDTEAVDPVTELEGRYVRGELNDEEFEHRLETIIETEDKIDRSTETDHESSRRREVETETN
jgi:uncharacterized membrane protein